MPSPVEIQCATILAAAASAAIGIIVKTSNPMKARATLYRVRKMLGDTELAPLHIRVSPDDSEHELWIIRRNEAPGYALGPMLEED